MIDWRHKQLDLETNWFCCCRSAATDCVYCVLYILGIVDIFVWIYNLTCCIYRLYHMYTIGVSNSKS